MTNLWDDEEQEQFLDIPEETQVDANGQTRQAPPAQVQAPQRAQPAPQSNQIPFNGGTGRFEEQSDDTFLDEVLESLDSEENFEEVLNDANLRIEQGRLYQMIMNHDLFAGMDADPKAVQNVQREIRKFARESMEVMLGMRQTMHAPQPTSSPFNHLEVDILKTLASKATNGATESPDANRIAEAVREVPRRKTLNPIGGTTNIKRAAAPSRPQPQQPQQRLPAKSSAPMRRNKNDDTIDRILAEEGVSRADLELEYQGIGKKLSELTEQELSQRQKATQQRLARLKTVKSASAIPMASPEQQEMLALQRATQFKGVAKMDGLPIPGGMSALLDKVKSMPIKNPG